jgi:hypothetical protein
MFRPSFSGVATSREGHLRAEKSSNQGFNRSHDERRLVIVQPLSKAYP